MNIREARNGRWKTAATFALLLCALTLWGFAQESLSPLSIVTVGMRAPDFTLPDLGGKSRSLSDLRNNRVLILNFWAFWCDTWREEVVKYSELRREFPHLPFHVAAVSIDGARLDQYRRWVKEGRIAFPVTVMADRGGVVRSRYGISVIPVLFLLDRDGVVRYKHYGFPGKKVLATEIHEIMSRKESSDTGEKTISLTFDDFPHPETAGTLIRILRENGVKAVLFAIGRRALDHPELIKEASSSGFEIGNHSYDHIPFSGLSQSEIRAQVEQTNEVVEKLTGRKPRYLRPPGGKLPPSAPIGGMEVVRWTLDPGDILRPGREKIAERVLTQARNGSVVLLHDGVRETLEVLPLIIRELKGRGFRFALPPTQIPSRSH
ncbi:MAG: polysaccharide deacetylase family protein [Armatimonadetes bacterium]|nr:polysaccharide deacetylase family protein [Armatimonadota bacterium]